MDYEQFREQLADEVQKNLYEKGDVDVNITFNHVEKMNESYDSITVTPEGSNVGVNMNINHFYEGIEAGKSGGYYCGYLPVSAGPDGFYSAIYSWKK